MIRRSVRERFHTVYWLPPAADLVRPSILVANHHGWHDGYLMYLAAKKLSLPVVDWIQEFDAFPPFGAVGGMPFPADDPTRRALTIRRTIREMNSLGTSLVLFAEGELHRPGSLLPFGKALELVARKTPCATVIPIAIYYEYSLHERPDAFIAFGEAAPQGQQLGQQLGDQLAGRTRLTVAGLLDALRARVLLEPSSFQVLFEGKRDVNERWDMRRLSSSRRAKDDHRT